MDDEVKKREKGLRENERYLYEYNSFKKAKDLGIVFRPTDLTMEQINAFYEIELKINELKNG